MKPALPLALALCVAACSTKQSKEPPSEPPSEPEPARETAVDDGPIDVGAIWDRWIEATDARDAEALASLYTADATVTPASSGMTITGPEKIVEFFFLFGEAFPDMRSHETLRLINGSTVASVALTRGTHTKPMMGMPATNAKTSFVGLALVEIDNSGKIAKHTLYGDNLNFMAQLGAWKGPHRPYDEADGILRRLAERTGSKAEADNVRVAGAAIEAFNAQDVDALVALYADGAVLSDQSAPQDVTGDAIKLAYEALFTAFPDAQKRDHAMWTAGDWVVVTYDLIGTNKGPYPRLELTAGTDKPIRVQAADVLRVQDGKVAEHWVFADGMAIAMPLGAMTPNVAP